MARARARRPAAGTRGAGSRTGSKERFALRGRPDADPHADAQSCAARTRRCRCRSSRFRTHTQAVNVQDLERRFESGDVVTVEAMKAKGLGTRKGRADQGSRQGLDQQAADDPGARLQRVPRAAAIEAAGGTCEVQDS